MGRPSVGAARRVRLGLGPATPWFYGGYFAPEPYYPTPALWLTDYLLAANLRLAYESQQQQQAPPPEMAESNGVALTPEIKMQIAEEVRQQLAARASRVGAVLVGTSHSRRGRG